MVLCIDEELLERWCKGNYVNKLKGCQSNIKVIERKVGGGFIGIYEPDMKKTGDKKIFFEVLNVCIQ